MTRRNPFNRNVLILCLGLAATAATSAANSDSGTRGAPQNSTAPTISGTALEGAPLNATAGSWSGQISQLSFAWQRCAGSCSAISGATAPSYVPGSADVGTSVKVVVYASGKKGSSSAVSGALGPIAPEPSSGTPPPSPPAPTPPPPSPTIAFSAPSAGATLSGTETAVVDVANGTPSKVALSVDGNAAWSDAASPYSGAIDTTKLANGTHTLAARATFSDGSAISASESVSVQNDAGSPPPPPPPAPSPGNGSPIGLWHLGSSLSGLSHLDQYGLVIVSADGAAQARSLPGRTLIYSNASGLESAYSEGLSYTTAKANGWLLGQGSNGKWVVDHTKPALNQAMADALVQYAKSSGLKGVFLDDVVPVSPYGVTTPSGWREGMVSFVHLVHQELHAAGLYLLTNANAFADSSLGDPNNGSGDLAWAKLLAPDGVLTEEYEETRDGTYRLRTSGSAWYQNWAGWQSYEAGVQAAGMDFVGLNFGNPTYGYASTLVQDGGHATFIHATHDGSDPWGSWAVDLGAASDPAGSNPRRFAGGTVSVNASAASASLG